MQGSDEDLLARLNRLKQSSVHLGSSRKVASVDVESGKLAWPATREDALAERLKSLRSSGASTYVRQPTLGDDAVSSLIAKTTDEVRSHPMNHEEWQHELHGEQSLDELLEEFGAREQWTLSPDDRTHTTSLLNEANSSLPERNRTDPTSEDAAQEDFVSLEPEPADGEPESSQAMEGKSHEQNDEEEADKYVKQVLAQLEIEMKYGGTDAGEDNAGNDPEDSATLDLPSTPSKLPEPAAEPSSFDDGALEARFASLALNLPSTPTSAPTSQQNSTRLSAKKPNLPKYTDEDIDSWCCICNEDGAFKCLGCDGDIYCNKCWREGHGNGPGQEQGHKAVQYTKGGSLATG